MNDQITKRPKLELSDSSEPLTQKDVISFQKEALFRCLNKWRVKANQLVEENELLSGRLATAFESVSGCCAAVVVLAKSVIGGCTEEQDKLLLQKLIDTKDELTLAQMISNNSARICELVLKSNGTDVSGDVGRFQELEALTLSLKEMLNTSENKLKKATEYYENLIAQYDRQDSATVARIFASAEDENKSVKKEASEQPGVHQSKSNGNQDGKEQSLKGDSSSKDAIVSEAEYEMKINDLNTEISVLEVTVKELTEWKEKNEKELTELRQTAESNRSLFSSSKAAQYNTDSGSTAGNEKINMLVKQNEELQQMNESYMAKFQQLSSDREIFNNKLTTEFHTAQETLKRHNASLEKDLVRIRTIRDELLAKVSMLEAQKTKSEMLEDLEKSLKIQQEQLARIESSRSENASQDALMKELQDLEKAFKEVSHLSNKKYSAYLNQESVLSKLTVEKTKASEKYFAAMRSKDAIMIENKNLTKNLQKSNELITQLKDLEKTLQQKIDNLHKQLKVSQENESRLKTANKETSVKIAELTSDNHKLKKSTERLGQENHSLIQAKTSLESKVKDKEIENKQLKIKVSSSDAKSKKLYKSLASNGGDNGALAEELENFRTIIYCPLCSKNWKNTVLKTCGHVFCDVCCKERLAARMRKCPICNKPFSANDLLTIHL